MDKVGEIKSVKVDNWGVFFLQKLQNFFNKTDYCDLTLQFRDNSQLKVHRLVLSACTDYFNVLEQTCETVDDALIMPYELQADVVVPIVNFMYTGTLEFELKMYGKLLRTAKEMNMTVLLKLLEAHRRTMEGVSRSQRPPSPRGIRRRVQQNAPGNARNQSPGPRRIVTNQNNAVVTTQVPRGIQITKTSGNSPMNNLGQIRQQLGSGITILKTSSAPPNKSQIVSTPMREMKGDSAGVGVSNNDKQDTNTSPFEQLRKGYNNNKRPSTSVISPPAKKPNLDDVKEFAEQQRMRKQIAAEYGDDQEAYDQLMEDAGIHHDDDDDEDAGIGLSNQGASTSKQAQTQQQNPLGSQQQQQQNQQQQQPQQQSQQIHNQVLRSNGENTVVSIRHEGPDRQPTIIVRENGTTKLNHARIIQEVLRKYPNLVKGSRNIKLKILPSDKNPRPLKTDEPETITPSVVPKTIQAAKITPPSASTPNVSILPNTQTTSSPTSSTSSATTTTAATGTSTSPPPRTVAKPQGVSSMTNAPRILKQQVISSSNTAVSSSAVSTDSSGKKRIDSKTMHALIAQGAENRTGPWLCLRCGVNNRPISIPSYRSFRRHLINTHNEKIDPALCEHCGWRSQNERNLHFHIFQEHKIKSNHYNFEECKLCSEVFEDYPNLQEHMSASHPDDKQHCIYCNKVFTKEIELYTHMKTIHKDQAIEDGIIDPSDEEYMGSQDEDDMTESSTSKEKKIQILSNIPIQSDSQLFKDNQNDMEPKFVTPEGKEVFLTPEQRKQIISQLSQEVDGESVVMFLNEGQFSANRSNASDTQGQEHGEGAEEGRGQDQDQEMEDAAAKDDNYDDSQIYEEMNNAASNANTKGQPQQSSQQQQQQSKQQQLKKHGSKESLENLEWAENLISAQEMEQDDDDDDEEDDEDDEDVEDPEDDDEDEDDDDEDDEEIDNEKLLKEDEEQAKKQQDINKKLKELTGEWSDDEDDGDEEGQMMKAEQKDAMNKSHQDELKAENADDGDEDDDIDLALKNLHKEPENMTGDEDSQGNVIERLDDDIKTDDEISQPSTVDRDDLDNKMDVDMDDADTEVNIDLDPDNRSQDTNDTANNDEENEAKENPCRDDEFIKSEDDTRDMITGLDAQDDTLSKDALEVHIQKLQQIQNESQLQHQQHEQEDEQNEDNNHLSDDAAVDNSDINLDKLIHEASVRLVAGEEELPSTTTSEAPASSAEEAVDEVASAQQPIVSEASTDDQSKLVSVAQSVMPSTPGTSRTSSVASSPHKSELEKTSPNSKFQMRQVVAAETIMESEKTPETVKSLISDWADEGDEEEDKAT